MMVVLGRARGTFLEVGVLKKLERSERSKRSANRRGVQRFQTFEYSLIRLF